MTSTSTFWLSYLSSGREGVEGGRYCCIFFLNDVIKICLLPVSLLQGLVYRKHGLIEELVVNKCALAQKSYLKQERDQDKG